MTVTRLKRKHRKNIARANNKQHIIKELLRTPVLKNVDLDELKSRFPATSGVAGTAAAVKTSAAAVVDKEEDKVEAVAVADESAGNAKSFNEAEAVTKPVNEDGQPGEHPKPEIAL